MDSAVFEKLGVIMSDPTIGEKINAIISGDVRRDEKPTHREEVRCDGGESPRDELKTSCDASSLPPCPCKSPSCPQTVKNGRALLLALKPYMDDKRCEKIDRILSAMKLAELFEMFGKLL